jgi:AcrR family transcriptional regulator
VERLSADDFVREAFDVLGDYGVESLTIAVLCQRLAVTKGSFYHHFGGLPGFVEYLLASWETADADKLAGIGRDRNDPAARVVALVELTAALPHAPEAAIRAWARSDTGVAEVVARVDKRRERQWSDAMVALGVERTRARLLTRLVLNAVVGTQVREDRVDARRLRLMLDDLARLVISEAQPRPAARLRSLLEV